MRNENRSITNSRFHLLVCCIAALALSVSALAQKPGNKPGKNKEKPKAQSPAKKNDQPSQDPCPTEEGEEEPRVAANTGSGKTGWPWHPAAVPVTYLAPSCAGEFTVTLDFAAKGKGTRYYQIVLPANAGLTLVGDTKLNQVHTLDFPGDCDVKTLTLTFRLLQRPNFRPTRSFFIQWVKPAGGNSNASLKAGGSMPARGYQKGKAHLVKIVCP